MQLASVKRMYYLVFSIIFEESVVDHSNNSTPMLTWINILGWTGLVILFVGFLTFLVTSFKEKRKRASFLSLLIFIPTLGLMAVLLLYTFPHRTWVLLGIFILMGLFFLLTTLPLGKKYRMRIIGNQEPIDERMAIFHRFHRIQPGMTEFDSYYKAHPDKTEFDEKVRSLPQLGYPGSRSYHLLTSPFMVSTFDVLERMTRNVEWSPDPIEQQPVRVSPHEVTLRIKGFARYLGADLIGITKLNPAYVYSHIGRSPGEWGAPISLDHAYAIAICVEMDHDMIRHAPHHATSTETAYKYFKVAQVATVVARYINLLGYEARAHVDGNYRVLCVPIAVDAGLGELGRSGLLITPEFGPRVRISIVTTNMPMTEDDPVHFGVQNFCDFCKKCATNCPSAAIQSHSKSVINGVEKWQSIQESCYKYWRIQGSDCSVCIHVCPYSHPRSFMHNAVRWAIRRNALTRRIALFCDDLFYGRRPGSCYPLPDWHDQSPL